MKIYLGHNNSVIVIGVYRSPSAPSEALEKIGELIAQLIDQEVIILGDLNLDWLTSASSNLKEPGKYPACGVFDLDHCLIVCIRNVKQRKTNSHILVTTSGNFTPRKFFNLTTLGPKEKGRNRSHKL